MDIVIVVPELAHHMALIPLLWLGLLWTFDQTRGAELWWIAGAFAISWLADTAAHWVDPQLVSAVYPVSQSAIIAAVLLPRGDAIGYLFTVTAVALIGIAWQGLSPASILRAGAWGAIIGLVLPLPIGRLRTCLLVAYGLGLVSWLIYAGIPGWTTWLIYQGTRLAAIVLFCWASWKPQPLLRLVHGHS